MATPTGACGAINLEKEKVFTLKEVSEAAGGLKSRKAAGTGEIRPEMLKALNGERLGWLTSAFQVARFGKTSTDW